MSMYEFAIPGWTALCQEYAIGQPRALMSPAQACLTQQSVLKSALFPIAFLQIQHTAHMTAMDATMQKY